MGYFNQGPKPSYSSFAHQQNQLTGANQLGSMTKGLLPSVGSGLKGLDPDAQKEALLSKLKNIRMKKGGM